MWFYIGPMWFYIGPISVRYNSISVRYDFISGRYDFISSRYNFVSGRYDFISDRYSFISDRYNFISVRCDFISGRYDFMSGRYDFISVRYRITSGRYPCDLPPLFATSGDPLPCDLATPQLRLFSLRSDLRMNWHSYNCWTESAMYCRQTGLRTPAEFRKKSMRLPQLLMHRRDNRTPDSGNTTIILDTD